MCVGNKYVCMSVCAYVCAYVCACVRVCVYNPYNSLIAMCDTIFHTWSKRFRMINIITTRVDHKHLMLYSRKYYYYIKIYTGTIVFFVVENVLFKFYKYINN